MSTATLLTECIVYLAILHMITDWVWPARRVYSKNGSGTLTKQLKSCSVSNLFI